MTVLQFLGLFIPVFCILSIFLISLIQIINGKGNEIAPSWMIILLILSTFILIFTLVTIVCLN